MKRSVFLPVIALVLCSAAFADTWYVDKDNTAGPWNGTTWPTAFATIQDGINAASDTDEVIVAEGIYVENINFNGKNITLRSTDPTNASVVAATVIDGNHVDSVVTFSGTETTDCVLAGFTITNGSSAAGGGIAGNNCHAGIENNIISGNSADSGGGAHMCRGTIQDNTIAENSAGVNGGGLAFCHAVIRSNVVRANSATNTGGGLYKCNGTIENNILLGNSVSDSGGGIGSCDGAVRNNTIYGNSAARWGGGLSGCSGTISNCIIWQNTARSGPQLSACVTPTYSCIQDWQDAGEGNISDGPGFANPENGDFHLRPDSPCIDAGGDVEGLTDDFDGDSRPFDATGEPRGDGTDYDIGADEFYGDVDSDGDGLTDDDEVAQYGTDPFDDDSDDDGVPDGDEINTHLTDPLDADSDDDAYTDYVEIARGTDPNASDSVPVPMVVNIPADYATIQEAIDAAIDGDEIVVSPGTYVENISLNGKNFILRSTDPTDPDVVANTIIDGNDAGSVVTFAGTESQDFVLAGLTITNGNVVGTGGGIKGNGTLATIEKNVISGNFCGWYDYEYDAWFNGYGGGLANCDGTLQDNIISDNVAVTAGGGLYECDGTVQTNIISGNGGAIYGGGLAACSGIIQNNIISWNSASYSDVYDTETYGGGVHGLGSAIFRNNVVYGNLAFWGGGICSDGTITNCIVWGNDAAFYDQICGGATASYCCIQGWTGGGEGNISDEPRFADPENGDFHLQADSVCIDAGGYVSDLTDDFEGDPRGYDGISEPRGDGSDFDIGADEYIFNHDVNADGAVDALDVQLVINEALGLPTEHTCDVNEDGHVDALDVQLVINAALAMV